MKYYSFAKYFIAFGSLFFLLSFSTMIDNEVTKVSSLDHEIPSRNIYNNGYIKDIRFNKVIIIGDSRMQRLRDRKDSIDIPSNFTFIAEGGTKIKWFNDTAINSLNDTLNNMDKIYKYHVVINMGVNDLEESFDYSVYSDSYYGIIKNLIKKYPNVNFYFLSVNPIVEEVLNKWQPWSYRTNDKIKKFNYSLDKKLKSNFFENYYYCNSIDNLDFIIPDGIHYDKDTDQLIVDFIVNDCLNYD